MNVIDVVKNAAFSSAVSRILNYLENNPEENIQKAMELADKIVPEGWYESQRSAFRKAIDQRVIGIN